MLENPTEGRQERREIPLRLGSFPDQMGMGGRPDLSLHEIGRKDRGEGMAAAHFAQIGGFPGLARFGLGKVVGAAGVHEKFVRLLA